MRYKLYVIRYPLLIILAALLCYLPQAAKLSFVINDDYAFLHIMTSFPPVEDIKNFFIYLKKGIGWGENIPSPDLFTKLCCIGGLFRPVYNLYWFINFHLYGLNSSGYHLSILTIHVINALLIFYILSILTEHNALALLTSLIFSLHPAHNEAILLVTAGAGVLATFFFLLSLLLYLHWLKKRLVRISVGETNSPNVGAEPRESGGCVGPGRPETAAPTNLTVIRANKERKGLWRYVSSVIFFSLALMSYDSMFISALPILFVSSFLIPPNPPLIKGGKGGFLKEERWPQILLSLFPFMVMIGIIFLVRYNIMGTFTNLHTGYTSNFFKSPFQNGWSMLKQLLLLAPSANASPDAKSILELTASSLTSLKVILVPFFLSIIVTLAFTPTQPSPSRGRGWGGDLLHRAIHYPYLLLPFPKEVKSPLTLPLSKGLLIPPFSKGGLGGIRVLTLAVTWIFVGALPFMIFGGGALPARYSYFCSVGWSLLMALLFLACAKKLKVLLFVLIFPTLLIFYGANSAEIMYWKEAGQVCQLVLTKVKEKLPYPPLGSKIFILNVPQAIDRAPLAFDQSFSWTVGAMVFYRHMKNSIGFYQWRRSFFDRYGERDVTKAIVSYFIERLSPPSHYLELFLSFQKLIKRYMDAKGKEGEEEVLRWAYRFLANPELTLVLDYNMLRERAGEIIHKRELASKTFLFKFDGKDLRPIEYLVTLTESGQFRVIPIGSSANTDEPLLVDDLNKLRERLKPPYADWLRVDEDFLIIQKLPKIEHFFDTSFNGEISFLGFDSLLDENPYIKNLSISYYWKKMAQLKGNYTVFVHFLDSQGRIVFQQDHPLGGSFSEKWKPGEIMVENYRVEIPKDILKGRYSMRIGLWIPEKKEFIPMLKEGKAKKDIIGVIAGFLDF